MTTKLPKFGKIFLSIIVSISFAACANQINENVPKNKDEITRSNQANKSNNELLEAINSARESEKKVDLKLELDSSNKNEIIVNIVLLNPEEAQVNSVRSFLAYNPESLKGADISFPENSPFNLIAPGEKEFDEENGIAKIGISSSKSIITEKELIIAKISFSRLKEGFTTIDFYDPQEGGHTEVIGIFREHLKNILNTPSTPGLIIETTTETE